MDPVAFSVFGLPIYWYGILMASAIVCAAALCIARETRFGFERDTVLNLSMWAVPLALIGARVYYVIFSFDAYRDNLWSVFDTRMGGMAIYGAIIGGVITGWVYARRSRLPFGLLADLVAPGLAIGQAIGRWGNFINQEAYGVAVTDAALCRFPIAVYIEATGQWHLATFFYESMWCLIVCITLLLLERVWAKRTAGSLFLIYALLYSLERAVVEGLRTDSLMFYGFRVSQVLSIVCALLCLIILICRHLPSKAQKPHL